MLLAIILVFAAPAAASNAFELLDRTIATYAALPSYADHGEIVSTTTGPTGSKVVRFQTELVSDGDGGFRARLRQIGGGGTETVIWRDGDILKQWTSSGNATGTAPSVGSALMSVLGPEAVDAALVPLLLTRDTAALAVPEAAALDEAQPCGEKLCDLLTLGLRGGRSEVRIWIESPSGLINRLELEVLPPAIVRNPAAAVRRHIVFEHRREPPNKAVSAADVAFTPPPFADIQPLPVEAAGSRELSDIVVSDEISVALRSLAVRAVDSKNQPIRGLREQDFEVRIGKQEIEVLSADWISSRGSGLQLFDLDPDRPPVPLGQRDEANGNLIVLFVQSDFNSVRAKGHLRILPMMRDFLRGLETDDWVAVVSFDSHLKLWLDFSRDREAAGDAVERAVRFGAEPTITAGRLRSLAFSFPTTEAKRAATPEDALRLTARSLIDIPGEKIVVYLGWGLGRYGSSGFRLNADYRRALETLDRARTSVFVLDVTDADYHTLELGIQQVAADTGGTYARTNHFARREVMRLVETISGYYLLTLDRGQLIGDLSKLKLGLRHGNGRVLLRQQQLSR